MGYSASEIGGNENYADLTITVWLDRGISHEYYMRRAWGIDGYQAGDYKSYFPNGALIGKSANNYLVSFTFDSAGKISGVFMVADADLL